jgi:predicted ester cyclase
MPTANQQLATDWFEEVWNKGRREAITEMLHPDCILHDGGPPTPGIAAFHAYFDRMQSAFSDIRVKVEAVIGEGDTVCVRWSTTFRHTGAGMGVEPTGKPVSATGITIIRVADGMFVEGWQNWDMLGVLEQIGAREDSGHVLAVGA